MNITSIGVQLIQAGTATPHQSLTADVGDDSNGDRVAVSAPIQSPPQPGTGQTVDKTV